MPLGRVCNTVLDVTTPAGVTLNKPIKIGVGLMELRHLTATQHATVDGRHLRFPDFAIKA